jgi:ABC-type branched-subunit amino acid transport system ATPase component
VPGYLKVSGVSKRFGGLRALDQCSFTIERGKISCLVGPNGAGKTTIFNVITGFLRPDEGTISFNGTVLDHLTPRARIRCGIARTFQNLRLFGEMTALDNVVVYLKGDDAIGPIAALTRPFHTHAAMKRMKERALALLEDVGLAHKANDKPATLSFGQQELLCIARALATGADLPLLDEPTSGLSQSTLSGMVEMVHKLRDQGRTLLVVEHNTKIVQRIADEILFLHQGRLITQGAPEKIVTDPKLAEIYFGGAL